jgi:succinate-semialdehyde dehydrogenase/glutarate-semialdehyde dehydrogenase
MKAPSETPYSVLAIAELCKQAGVPDGVVNVVNTEKNVADVGKEICENPLVKKVSFTGSVRLISSSLLPDSYLGRRRGSERS